MAQKWDYLVVWLDDYKHVAEASLNGAPYPLPGKRAFSKQELAPFLALIGGDGWELTGTVYTWVLIFKRPT